MENNSEHIHSIIIIKEDNKYLNYYDKNWDMYLFPNLKGNNIKEIENKFQTKNVKFLFDKTHEKYSVKHKENRIYHHYFYEIKNADINVDDGKFFTLNELLSNPKIKKYNNDIISFIDEYYKDGGKTCKY